MDETASSIEKLRNPADGEEFKDFYDITIRSREIELCEKKEAWVCDSDAFLKEKTLRTLGKGKEIDEKTSLILDREISSISKVAKEKTYLTRGFKILKADLRAQTEKSISELEKMARRKAMDMVYKNLSLDEEKKYLELHGKFLEDLNAKVEKELQKRKGIE